VKSKYHIVILSNSPGRLSLLTEALEAAGECRLERCHLLPAAQELISRKTPDLVVVDETVDDQGSLSVARQLVMTNAMVNLAVVSRLPAEEFHQAAEGLGIMAQLPVEPSAADGARLLVLLGKMSAP
jgi:DNA-binding response OmpR family regulator